MNRPQCLDGHLLSSSKGMRVDSRQLPTGIVATILHWAFHTEHSGQKPRNAVDHFRIPRVADPTEGLPAQLPFRHWYLAIPHWPVPWELSNKRMHATASFTTTECPSHNSSRANPCRAAEVDTGFFQHLPASTGKRCLTGLNLSAEAVPLPYEGRLAPTKHKNEIT